MTLARATSFVTTRIVMAVLYFGTITPVGLLRRLVSDNPITQRATSNGDSPSNMERHF